MVEGNGLENRRAGNGTEGSNPSLSAIKTELCSIGFCYTNYISFLIKEKSSQTKCEPFCLRDEKNAVCLMPHGEVPKWLKGTVC